MVHSRIRKNIPKGQNSLRRDAGGDQGGNADIYQLQGRHLLAATGDSL
tara:strand:- start:3731 stop:3874 length:144 start_codon:yes stop_codon:yes gene_type:complete